MKKTHLTTEQRYEIQAYLKARDKNITEIAMLIGKDKSVVSREIKRNSRAKGVYNASYAIELVNIRKERFNQLRKMTPAMENKIRNHIINDQWSPEQIEGRYKLKKEEMVSHERIYQIVRKDKNLQIHTRHKLKHRKRPINGKHQIIKDKVSISERPVVINQRERIGDWEIDTIVGRQNKGAIVTIVERKTGFLIMRKLPEGKHAQGLKKVVIDMLLPYKNVVHSITSDNGSEFAFHKEIAKKLEATFYFADPYSSWQRGTNENTNKLIRQYIPKKQTFENYNDLTIKQIQYKLNSRPRKRLNFKEPKQLFFDNFENVAFTS